MTRTYEQINKCADMIGELVTASLTYKRYRREVEGLSIVTDQASVQTLYVSIVTVCDSQAVARYLINHPGRDLAKSVVFLEGWMADLLNRVRLSDEQKEHQRTLNAERPWRYYSIADFDKKNSIITDEVTTLYVGTVDALNHRLMKQMRQYLIDAMIHHNREIDLVFLA